MYAIANSFEPSTEDRCGPRRIRRLFHPARRQSCFQFRRNNESSKDPPPFSPVVAASTLPDFCP
jgi:hypothetical protein